MIPKSTHVDRMKENIAVFDFTLSNEEMMQINELDTGQSQFFDSHDPTAIKTIVSGGRPGANEN